MEVTVNAEIFILIAQLIDDAVLFLNWKIQKSTGSHMNNSYSAIRFIGYAIPTTLADYTELGGEPWMMTGTYLGHSDTQTDITKRIALLKNAVDQAKAQLPKDKNDVINVFVAPEFFFHGLQGPYIHQCPESDPVISLRQKLAETFNTTDYPNWTLVCGTVVTAMIKDTEALFQSNSVKTRNEVVKQLTQQWQTSFGPLKKVLLNMLGDFIIKCHAYPDCEVRDRSIIVSNVAISSALSDSSTNLMTVDKYVISNIDFPIFDSQGNDVITEQMIGPPKIDLSSTDAKQTPFDPYCIFSQGNIDINNAAGTSTLNFGIEICRDHREYRLRQNMGGKATQTEQVHIQIIPSCGMRIFEANVAVKDQGFVFNVDGNFALNDKPSGQANIEGVDCLYANYIDPNNQDTYFAHSQFARVDKAAIGKNPHQSDSVNATFHTLTDSSISVFDVSTTEDLQVERYFAGGSGQLHIYGLEKPFAIFNSGV